MLVFWLTLARMYFNGKNGKHIMLGARMEQEEKHGEVVMLSPSVFLFLLLLSLFCCSSIKSSVVTITIDEDYKRR